MPQKISVLKISAIIVAVLTFHVNVASRPLLLSQELSLPLKNYSAGQSVFEDTIVGNPFNIETNEFILECPSNISVNTTENECSAEISKGLNVHAFKGNPASLTWEMAGATVGFSPSSGINPINAYDFNKGTTRITYTGKDIYSNVQTCSFLVSVHDNQPPRVLQKPDNVEVIADPDHCGAFVNWQKPLITDNCSSSDQLVIKSTHLPGSFFPVGTTTVTYTVTDGNENNKIKFSFFVTVLDTTPPVLKSPENIFIGCEDRVLTPYTTLQAFLNAGGVAIDNCVDPSSFRLIEERKSRKTCPYIITRTYQLSDYSGNTSTVKHRFFVGTGMAAPDTTAPYTVVIRAKPDIPQLKSGMADYTAVQSGIWNDPATWGGTVPASTDNVTIPAGVTVTVDALSVCTDLTIDNGGILNFGGGYTLQVNGNWTNNGTFNAGSGTVAFTGTASAVIGGASVSTYKNFTLDKGSLAGILQVSSNIEWDGSISLTSGLLQINSGASVTCTGNSGFTVETDAGIFVNGGTLSTGSFSVENKGLIRIDSGNLDFGTNVGNSVVIRSSGTFDMNGGTIDIAGRVEVSGGTVDISGGILNLNTVGHNSSTTATLDLSLTSVFNMTAGTINFLNSNGSGFYDVMIENSTGTKNFSGGTLNFGSGAAETYRLFSDVDYPPLSAGSNVNLEFSRRITSTGTYIFPLTDGSGSSIPLTVNLFSGSINPGATINITTTSSKYPSNESDFNFLNRFWDVTLTNISSPGYDISARYSEDDIAGTEAQIAAGVWTGGFPWVKLNPVNTATNTLSANSLSTTSIIITGIADAPPTVSINNGDQVTLCMGNSVTFTTTVTGDAPISYLWSPAAGLSSTSIPNPVASPSANTTYTVQVSDGNGFTATDQIEIIVNPIPSVSATPATQQICPGGAITQINITNPNNVADTEFSWTRDNTSVLTGIPANGSGSPITGILNSTNPGALETTTFTITATANGCSSTTTVSVTVGDVDPPSAVCRDITVQLDATGAATIAEDAVDNGSSDACRNVSFDTNITAFDCSDIGNNPVVLTVTDNVGNTATCNANVTVEDNIAPVAACRDITIQLDASGQAIITADNINDGSSDACGIQSLTASKTSFDCTNTGDNTVTLTVTDNNGNISTCDATITVEDNIAPAFTSCPVNLVYGMSGGSCGRLVNGDDILAAATDNCGVQSLSWAMSGAENNSGEGPIGNYNFDAGVTNITYTATDAAGNSTECSFTVTVNDNLPPILTCPGPITVNNSPGFCYADFATVGLVYASATDNCNPNPTITGTRSDGLALTANYPVGITTITWTASDGINTTSCTQAVEVIDNEMPTFTPPASIVINSGNSCNPDLSPAITGNVFSKLDNCTTASNLIVTYADDPPVQSGCSGNYTITRNWFVTDNAGNVASNTQLITVEDHSAPTLTIPANLEVECDDDHSPANTGNATATDNCSSSSEITITYTDVEVDNGCLNHRITRTWIATDCAGNSSSANQIITITDLTPPVFTNCPDDWHVDTPDDIPPPENVPLNVTDNCGGPVTVNFITEDYTGLEEGAGFCPRTVRRVFEAIDECGNRSTCEYIIYVDNLDDCYICQSTVPVYHIDLVGQPSGAITLEDIRREQEGVCCDFKYKDQLRCVSFNIELDPQTIAVTMLVNGALPSPKDYRINCYDVDPIGDVVCLPGDDVPAAEFYNFVYCKEGNNPNDFTFIYHSGVVATGDLTTRVDCSGQIDVEGVTESSVTFTDITGNGYERYLNHPSGDLHPIFTPDADAPGVVRYEVCGDFEGETTVCQGGSGCGIVEITVLPKIEIQFDIDPQAVCENNPPQIHVAISPEPSPLYTYEYWWYNGYDAQGTPINSVSSPTFQPSVEGPYSIKVVETKTGVICNTAIHNFDWEYDYYPPQVFAPAADLTIICNDPAAPQQIADWLETAYILDEEGNISPIEPDNDFTGIDHFCNNTIPVTFTASDDCGNIGSATRYIHVIDITPPVISPPVDGSSECSTLDPGSNPGYLAWLANHGGATATDECDSDLDWTDNSASQSWSGNPANNQITVTFTATDDCGNSSQTSATYSVIDDEPPTIVCPESITETATIDNCDKILATPSDPQISDLCSIPELTYSLEGATTGTGSGTVTGVTFNVGITTVTYKVTDAAGLTATCQFDVTVIDVNPPVFTLECPLNEISADADPGLCTAALSIPAPAVTDFCQETVTLTNDSPYGNSPGDASGNYPVGTTTFTWTAVDASGNTATCQQTVTVNDTQNPQITCPPNVEDLITDGGCDLVPGNIEEPVYSDNCPDPVLTYHIDYPDGTTGDGNGSVSTMTFPVGISTVTYAVTDGAGLTDKCTFTIWIKNLDAPQFDVTCRTGAEQDITVSVAPGSCNAFVNILPPIISNPCNEVYTIINDSPYRTSDADASGTYPLGTTTINWTITDASDNVHNCTQTVTVIDDISPIISCPPNVEDLITDGGCDRVPGNIEEPVYSDNCPDPVLTYHIDYPDGTTADGTGSVSTMTFPVGISTVTYTVTDGAGLTDNCTFTIWIKNLDAPQFDVTCRSGAEQNISVSVDPGSCNAFVNILPPIISNPCNEVYTISNDSPYRTSVSDASGTYPLGTTTINWTITDASDNVHNCTQTVTVIDDISPVISCPPNVEDLITDGGCDRVPGNIEEPVYSDNCPDPVLTYHIDYPDGTTADGTGSVSTMTFPVGISTVTYTVTDGAGLTDNCTFTIWIKNLDAPQFDINCDAAPDVTVNADPGMCGANVIPPPPGIVNPCNEIYTIVNDFTGTDDATGFYPVGTTTVTWTITDASGTIYTCEQQVVVIDEPPYISCPGPYTFQADWEVPYKNNVSLDPPVWGDNCPNPLLTWSLVPPAGYESFYQPGDLSGNDVYPNPNRFYVGVTTISYTVTDANGNTATCDFTVTVLAKPEIECPTDYITTTDPGVCTATRNSGDYGLPTLVSGVQPITWTWTITNPDGSPGPSGTITGSDTNPGPPGIPDYPFELGVSVITWRAENISGYDECSHRVIVRDEEPPTFTSVPYEDCVDLLQFVIYNPVSPNPVANHIDPNLEKSPSPDHSTFEAGNTALDLTNLYDNCCDPSTLIIRWRIDFADTPDPISGNLVSHSPVSGTGQPSEFGADILLWGDGVNFTNIIHHITYTVEDCNGNISEAQTREITVTPRPQIIKLN